MKVVFPSSCDQLWSKLCWERFNCLLAHSSVTGPVLDTNLDKLLGKQWKNAGVSIDLVLIVHRKFIHYHHHYHHHHHDHRDRQPHDHHHHPACLRQVMKTANSNFYFDITCPLPLFPSGQEYSFFLRQKNCQRHNGPKALSAFNQHLYFKTEVSTIFDIFFKLQLGFVWRRGEIHMATLSHPCNKSM